MDQFCTIIFIVSIIVAGVLGFLFGTTMGHKKDDKRNIGILRLDHSDDQPYLFLEMNDDGFSKIEKNKWVIMDVSIKDYLPR